MYFRHVGTAESEPALLTLTDAQSSEKQRAETMVRFPLENFQRESPLGAKGAISGRMGLGAGSGHGTHTDLSQHRVESIDGNCLPKKTD
jgi:hypothetical protein